MKREELLHSPEYWTTKIQMELYRQMESFMKEKHLNKSQLAEFLGCSKGYVSQLLSGDYDHKLSKFVALSLAINKIPKIVFTDSEEYIKVDQQNFYVRNKISTTSFAKAFTTADESNVINAA